MSEEESKVNITLKSQSVSRSVVPDSLQPPWTAAHQAPLSIGFSRQEYWSAKLESCAAHCRERDMEWLGSFSG